MGHIRIGTLPATKKWKEVVGLIHDEADVARVADATVQASEAALSKVQDDLGFREAVWLMTQLGIAAGQEKPLEHLSSVGIELSGTASLPDVVAALAEAMDSRVDAAGRRSDFGEMSQRALVGAVSKYVASNFAPLLGESSGDVSSALRKLKRKKDFGQLAKNFFAKLTNECLGYFLSKTMATHVGEGRRFTTMNQMGQFDDALTKHCDEAARIVEEFSADWFSKRRYEEGGKISRESVEGFGWYALAKMRQELGERAK